MKQLIEHSGSELIVRWILGALFIYASYHKIVNPAQFAKIIYGYYLFPDISINLIAIILPFLELFSGMALILGIFPRAGAIVINAMLLGFIIAISINIVRGHEFDCGCFSFGGYGHTSSAGQLLFRDTIGFLLGLYVLSYGQDRKWCIRDRF
jgi:putative oxidoreductase